MLANEISSVYWGSNSNQIIADTLIEDFFKQEIGLDYFSFKKYTNWLQYIDTGDNSSSIEIILDNPDSQQLELLDFKSLDSLKQWIDNNKPTPSKPTPSKPTPSKPTQSFKSLGM